MGLLVRLAGVGLLLGAAIPIFGDYKNHVEEERIRRHTQYAGKSCTAAGVCHVRSFGAPRSERIAALKQSGAASGSAAAAAAAPFDVLVLGGGATGTSVALDAVTRPVTDGSGGDRPLKVALVERSDFAGCTSSCSTKLLHGGVRYLEMAVFNLDIGMLELVREAMTERDHVLKAAPHLARTLDIVVPATSWWHIPWFAAGLVAYDMLSHGHFIGSTSVIGSKTLAEKFPFLRKEGMYGGVVYKDGQMNDARLCLAIAMSAADHGAVVVNKVEVLDLIKDDGGNVVGAIVVDLEADPEGKNPFPLRANAVVNATGPYADSLRKMESDRALPIMVPSLGGHLTISAGYTQGGMGLLVPKTDDGRVLFMLPFLGRTIVGTTDEELPLKTLQALPGQAADFIRYEGSKFVAPEHRLTEGKTLSTWCGYRPLVRLPEGRAYPYLTEAEHAAGLTKPASKCNKKSSASLSRSHYICVGPGKMVTIVGGKWTTCRSMAEDTMDAVSAMRFTPARDLTAQSKTVQHTLDDTGKTGSTVVVGTSQTLGLELAGAQFYHDGLVGELQAAYPQLLKESAEHLVHSYGTRSFDVAGLGIELEDGLVPIVENFPYIHAEVDYSVKAEAALSAVDVLARRTRLAFLDEAAARKASVFVISRMTELSGWDPTRVAKEQALVEATLAVFTEKRV